MKKPLTEISTPELRAIARRENNPKLTADIETIISNRTRAFNLGYLPPRQERTS